MIDHGRLRGKRDLRDGDAPSCAAAVATGRTPVSEICSVACGGGWTAALPAEQTEATPPISRMPSRLDPMIARGSSRAWCSGQWRRLGRPQRAPSSVGGAGTDRIGSIAAASVQARPTDSSGGGGGAGAVALVTCGPSCCATSAMPSMALASRPRSSDSLIRHCSTPAAERRGRCSARSGRSRVRRAPHHGDQSGEQHEGDRAFVERHEGIEQRDGGVRRREQEREHWGPWCQDRDRHGEEHEAVVAEVGREDDRQPDADCDCRDHALRRRRSRSTTMAATATIASVSAVAQAAGLLPSGLAISAGMELLCRSRCGVARSGHEPNASRRWLGPATAIDPSSTTTAPAASAASIRHWRATIEDRGHEPDQLRLEEQRHEQQTGEHGTAMIERLDGEDRREQHEAVRLTEKDPGSGFE